MSKVTLRHYGKITNGKKEYFNPALHKQQLDALEGQEFEEVIKKRFRKVSEDQFGFYFGGILSTMIQDDAFIHFNKVDDIHADVIAPAFLSYTKIVRVGKDNFEVKHIRSLSSLSKDEMREFIDKVIAWLLMEFNIQILSPEQYYLSLQNH